MDKDIRTVEKSEPLPDGVPQQNETFIENSCVKVCFPFV